MAGNGDDDWAERRAHCLTAVAADRLANTPREKWTPQEREHVDGCEYCRRYVDRCRIVEIPKESGKKLLSLAALVALSGGGLLAYVLWPPPAASIEELFVSSNNQPGSKGQLAAELNHGDLVFVHAKVKGKARAAVARLSASWELTVFDVPVEQGRVRYAFELDGEAGEEGVLLVVSSRPRSAEELVRLVKSVEPDGDAGADLAAALATMRSRLVEEPGIAVETTTFTHLP